MTHFNVEDIARFAEGNADKFEHEKFIKHIAQCERCRKIYSTTLKFVENERGSRKVLKFPSLPKIELRRFMNSFDTILTKKKLGTAVTAILIVIILSFLFNIFFNRTINEKMMLFIKNSNKEIEYKGFDAIYPLKVSAVRAGFFVEDLFKILDGVDKGELVRTLYLLEHELKNILKEKDSRFSLDLQEIGKEDLETVVQTLTELNNKSVSEVFQFGRFVEKTIFNSFKKERAEQREVEKYLRIVEKNSLHHDVIKKLKKVNNITNLNEYRKVWIAIRNSFSYSDYMRTKSEDHPLTQRAFAIFERVKNVTDKKEVRRAQLFIINARFNLYAIAVSDGRIIINPETLNICYSGVDKNKGDYRLAFILGHELAHLVNNNFFHREIFQVWEQYGIIPSKFLKNAEENRQKELKADELGALYTAMAGYDIRSLFEEQDNFFSHWERQISRDDIHRETQDYPSFKERVAAIRSLFKKVAEKAELFRAGVLLLQKGSFEDAGVAFREFEKEYPAREVYNNIGACSFNSAQYLISQKFSKEYLLFRLSTAIDYSTSADPDRGEGNEAEIELIRKHLKEAIAYFRMAASRDKIDKSCRYNLAASLILIGEYAEARDVCDNILAEYPSDVNALNNKAIALYYNKEKDQEIRREAIGLLEKAYQLEPKNFEVLYNLGSLKKTGARIYKEKYLKLPDIPRDSFYEHVYRELKGTEPPPRKTDVAPEFPAGINIGMDFATVEKKWGKKNTEQFNLPYLFISVFVKDCTRVVALEGDVVIIEKELSTAEEIEKLLKKFGPPQRVMRQNSGNFYIYEEQGFSIKEINGKVLSYIWFE